MIGTSNAMCAFDGPPLVTFFVMAYNQEQFVREAIKGAFDQTWQPLEIILSDDCSSDGTFRIMEEMVAAYQGPHTIRLNRNQTTIGIVPHVDRIMELASGELIIQNAGDDVSRPDRTEILTRLWLDSDRQAKLLHSAAALVDHNGQKIGKRLPRPLMIEDPSALNIVRHGVKALGAAAAWEKELFTIFGPLGADLGVEDTILSFRATLLGKIVYSDEELLSYRIGGASWKPADYNKHERLYGMGLQLNIWRAQNMRHILNNLMKHEYSHKSIIKKICQKRAATFQLIVDLAKASYLGKIAMLPRVFADVGRTGSWRSVRLWWQYLITPRLPRNIYRGDESPRRELASLAGTPR